MSRRSLASLLLCAVLLLPACAPQKVKPVPPVTAVPAKAPPPPVSPPVIAPPTQRYERVEWSQLGGWGEDELGEAWAAFISGCGALKSRADWKQVCELALRSPESDTPTARQFFETQFEPWRVAYDDERGQPSQTGLITGYYEPVLSGARKRGGRYTTPLHAVPDDLLTVELSDLYPQLKGEHVRGRLQGKRVLPYYDRAALDSNAALKGRELVWVDDAVDAFFLQVQGSGRVRLPDGEVIRLAYADQNGQPYKAIGRYLVEKHELTVEQATAPGLRQWLAEHPERVREVLNVNPSVVFFKEEQLGDPRLGPKGALGVPLTAGRSVAVDSRNLPLGAPLFLATTEPGSTTPLTRLVMAQDTGGAIRGVVRADLFWGLGAEAGLRAGNMRQQGNLWLLWPKGRPLPAPGPGVAPLAGASVELQSVLDEVGRKTGKRFLLEQRTPVQIRLGSFEPAGVTYPILLGILRNNGLAAVTINDIVNIVPEAAIRSYPLPTVSQDDAALADDEWVTRSVALKYIDAEQTVRVLRPLLPMNGFLAAVTGANTLVIVDRYANTRRLVELLRSMDKPPAK
jgi:membrane-bound lytic murein transglycosylase A